MLARLQGLRTLRQIQLSLSQGQIPAEELIDGVLILFGGILLVMPGVLTDLFALVLLLPFTRTYFKRWLRRRFDRMVAAGMSGSDRAMSLKFVRIISRAIQPTLRGPQAQVVIPGKVAIAGATRNPEI